MATLCLHPSNYMRPSTNRLRSAPFQGANTGSSPVGCTSKAVDNRAVRLPKSTHPTGAGKIIVPMNMRAWCNGSHAALRTPCRKACRFKSCRSHQIPFTLSVEAMSFTFIPRFNYPELPNNSLRLCRICRSVGMVDKEVSKTFAETRVGSSPIFGTKGAHSNISFEEY